MEQPLFGIEDSFAEEIVALLIVAIPTAIVYAIWRAAVSNHSESQQLLTLGLFERHETKHYEVIPSSLLRLTGCVLSFVVVYLIGPDNLEQFFFELLKEFQGWLAWQVAVFSY